MTAPSRRRTTPAGSAPGHCLIDTPIGPLGLAWGRVGLRVVQLPEIDRMATEIGLRARVKESLAAEPPPWIVELGARLRAHLGGELQDFAQVPLELDGVPEFHRRVYQAARQVLPGQKASYGELAARVGSPGAARAVGQAMGKNPFPIVVPCHRIVAAGGKLGGYSGYGGLALKRALLELEAGASDRSDRPGREGPERAESLFEGMRRPSFDGEAAAAHLCDRDPRLARLIAHVGPLGLRLKALAGPFEALAEAIVYQQLNGRAAATILGRVKALYGARLPSPEELLRTPEATLRAAGLSASKQRALRDLAEKVAAGLLPSLEEMAQLDDETLVERLTVVRGVGRWTVEMLLIFRLGRPDVLPLGDYGVRKGYARAFGTQKLPTPEVLARRGERWRPFRSVASWYLWRAAELPDDVSIRGAGPRPTRRRAARAPGP
jgi:methylated-DNA-[protein]-cysteine S-methyltransferase